MTTHASTALSFTTKTPIPSFTLHISFPSSERPSDRLHLHPWWTPPICSCFSSFVSLSRFPFTLRFRLYFFKTPSFESGAEISFFFFLPQPQNGTFIYSYSESRPVWCAASAITDAPCAICCFLIAETCLLFRGILLRFQCLFSRNSWPDCLRPTRPWPFSTNPLSCNAVRFRFYWFLTLNGIFTFFCYCGLITKKEALLVWISSLAFRQISLSKLSVPYWLPFVLELSYFSPLFLKTKQCSNHTSFTSIWCQAVNLFFIWFCKRLHDTK